MVCTVDLHIANDTVDQRAQCSLDDFSVPTVGMAITFSRMATRGLNVEIVLTAEQKVLECSSARSLRRPFGVKGVHTKPHT